MESARAVSGFSPDVSRANAVEKTPTPVPTNQRSGNEPRVEVEQSSIATIESLREDFREALEAANERLSDRGASVNVSIDKSTDTVIVQVKDRNSGETVRQIPPEVALQISRNIERLTGILVDRKA